MRTVLTNPSCVSHRVSKRTNRNASRGVTAQECMSSTTAARFRFASAGAVGVLSEGSPRQLVADLQVTFIF